MAVEYSSPIDQVLDKHRETALEPSKEHELAEFDPYTKKDGSEEKRSKGLKRYGRGDKKLPTTDLNPVAQNLAKIGFLRAFDPASGAVTFAFELNGKFNEIHAHLSQSNVLYRDIYAQLLGQVGQNTPFQIRLAMSAAGNEVISVKPAIDRSRDKRFTVNRTTANWTVDLDNAVNIDFNQKAMQFVTNDFFRKLGEGGTDGEQIFANIREKAWEVFSSNARQVGIDVPDVELRGLFDKVAATNYDQTMAAGENGFSVRYNTRISFTEQSKHIQGRPPHEIAEALANYSMQSGVVETAALMATEVPLEDGKVGSLYEQQQTDLKGKNLLLAVNPDLESNYELYQGYSHSVVRLHASILLNAALCCADANPARPDVDDALYHLKFGAIDDSIVLQGLNAVPNTTPGEKRAGAFLAETGNISSGNRMISQHAVGTKQTEANPSKKQIAEQTKVENPLTHALQKTVTSVEDALWKMSDHPAMN